MSKYLSNRQKNLKVGIVSYTEDNTVLQVTGKVGIGTTNAESYELYVDGDINFNGSLNQNGSPFVASRWTAGTGDDIYRLDGNVGVGTTNPTSKLTVGGDAIITGIATVDKLDVNQLSPDGVDYGTDTYVPIADGSGGWSWQPITLAGAGSLDGITVRDEGSVIGAAGSITTLDFKGNNIIATASAGFATITTSDTPTYDNLTVTGVSTFQDDVFIDGDLSVSGLVTATEYYGDLRIGTPTDGFQSGAIAITTSSFTKDAIDDINFVLGKLIPKPPTTINGVTLSLTGLTGTGRLCAGFTPTNNDVGTITPSAGTSYNRNTTNSVSSSYLTQYGPGDSGTVVAYISNVGVGTTTMTTSDNTGTYGDLQIANNIDAFLSTRDVGIASGFYQIYDARIITASSLDGFNSAYIQHVDGGNTYTTTKPIWYEDPSTVSAPVLSAGSTSTPSSGSHVVAYSSGIPHYTNSASNPFTYVLTCQNATGDMYSTNTFCTTGGQTNGFQTPGTKSYTDFDGGTNPPTRNYGVGTGVTTLVTQIPRDVHLQVTSSTDKFSTYTASTPYGSSGTFRASLTETINIMGTTATTAKIDEDNILISSLGTGSGNAVRVNAGLGIDNPVPVYTSWNASVSVASSEATVVGGILKYDVTDYSTGYLPVGPDYSTGRETSQYVQFQIVRSNVSQFKINVTGTYSDCWVTMPDNSVWTTSLSGTNGWADMSLAYRGSGVPTTSEPGCASGSLMTGSSGSFTCTFGTESSSNDTNNRILVRFKLTSGQSITALSFSS